MVNTETILQTLELVARGCLTHCHTVIPMDLYIQVHGYSSGFIVQELCESRGGRPGLSVLTSLLVSVDVKNY